MKTLLLPRKSRPHNHASLQPATQALATTTSNLEPTIFVIFGVTGNLAQRRLLPALYHLMKDNLLPDHIEIVGVSRQSITIDSLLERIELCVLEEDKVCDPVVLSKFRKHFRMVQLDLVKQEDYARLRQILDTIETDHGICMNRLFYLSIPPQVYEPVIENMGQSGLQKGCQHGVGKSRLLVEKPFGYDLASAKELIVSTERYFREDQIYRIDHYLAKETVQNILVFRQHNPVFASVWDNQHVRSISIYMSEQIGVEGRATFYDNVGALRDVVQNHLMQLLALVTMDLPYNLTDSGELHKAKQKLLTHIQLGPLDHDPAYRGQYIGYRDEVGNPRSMTETYAEITLRVDSPRWQGVPVRIIAGKAMKTKRTMITFTFGAPGTADANKLTFRIQPDEGIDICMTVKRPGFEHKTEIVQMDFSYQNVFDKHDHPDAYERVLLDAIKGDHSLFTTSVEVLESWRILQPVLDHWEQTTGDLELYEPGSDGPAEP